MNVEVFDAGSNSNNIPLVKHSAMGGQFISFQELSLGSSKISEVFHVCVHGAGRCHPKLSSTLEFSFEPIDHSSGLFDLFNKHPRRR